MCKKIKYYNKKTQKYKKENYNYNQGFEFIWGEMKVMITFESDWKKAE